MSVNTAGAARARALRYGRPVRARREEGGAPIKERTDGAWVERKNATREPRAEARTRAWSTTARTRFLSPTAREEETREVVL
eukprot:evm.model.NODE_27191_length_32237_cov_31.285324.5